MDHKNKKLIETLNKDQDLLKKDQEILKALLYTGNHLEKHEIDRAIILKNRLDQAIKDRVKQEIDPDDIIYRENRFSRLK